MDEIRKAWSMINHMLGIRTRREGAWRDLSGWLCPYRGVFEGSGYDSLEEEEEAARFTLTASQAVLRAASGMSSGMTPRNISWFKPCFTDAEMEELSGARVWLDALDTLMKDCLADGGFYQAIQYFNTDLVWAGCGLLYTEKGEGKPMRFECCQVGTYCVALDSDSHLEAVCRCLSMTPREMARVFGKEALSEATAKKLETAPYEAIRVWHLVRAADSGRWPVTSLYLEEGTKSRFLRKSGYYEMPYFFTAWHPGTTPYGTGPGDQCLADARQLDYLERHKLSGMGKLANPPLALPPHLKDSVDLSPGGLNLVGPNDRIGQILDLSPYARALVQFQAENQAVSQRLQDGLMASIFASMPMDQRPRDMSATEFLERKREALQQLGPVISAYEPNVLTPLLFRVAQTLDRAGLTPVPPPDLQNRPLFMKMDFISPMANALRQTGAETTRAIFSDVAAILQATQSREILDKIDLDQMVDELARGLGVPGKIIRPDEIVAKIRQQRLEAEAQAQQAQTQQVQEAQALDLLKEQIRADPQAGQDQPLPPNSGWA